MNTESQSGGVTAYPLSWPTNRHRTPSHRRARSRFDTTFAVARDELLRELKRLGGRSVVLSTNMELRNDGLPYASRRPPDDVGVAVYFVDSKGRRKCFACDRWNKIEDNLHAIKKTIEALRGIERWGSGEDMEAAFAGFAALPPAPKSRAWWDVLGIHPYSPADVITQAYRTLVHKHHPDRGGSTAAMQEVNAAFEAAKKERGFA